MRDHAHPIDLSAIFILRLEITSMLEHIWLKTQNIFQSDLKCIISRCTPAHLKFLLCTPKVLVEYAILCSLGRNLGSNGGCSPQQFMRDL